MLIPRALVLGFFAWCLATPQQTAAQQIRVGSGDSDTVARIVPRAPLREARHSIVTRDGTVALLMREQGVTLQFTDLGLEQATSGGRDQKKSENVLADVLGSMLRGGVRALLDRGVKYPLSELREARYEKGKLFFVRNDGDTVFDDVEINGVAVMENFAPRDARAFVAQFQAMKRDRASR